MTASFKKQLGLIAATVAIAFSASAQTFTLDSLRQMALRQSKTMAISQAEEAKSLHQQKAARTAYLPKVALEATYMRTGDEISLLNDTQKATLPQMGTSLLQSLGPDAAVIASQYPELAALFPKIGEGLNNAGANLVDALKTDTRNLSLASLMLTQPLYMGGKIRAMNQITDEARLIARQKGRQAEQELLLAVEQAYWQVVSLSAKRRIATQYVDMTRRLDDDMKQMIKEGVATKASGLSVSVKAGEAEMTLTKADNALTLSRMALCRLCGMPLDTPITLADEKLEELPPLQTADTDAQTDTTTAFAHRPELQMLESALTISRRQVDVARSDFMPQLALTGGLLTTYPGLTNGFEKKFKGTWAVGVALKVPVWNWGEGRHKVQAARADATIAALQLDEAKEQIALSLKQAAQRVEEADKQYALSMRNLSRADENLYTARQGFAEGVVVTSDLLSAQTAWVGAQSDKIDAQIDQRISRSALRKAQGILGF
ncbi:MAG: TolC family protein [Bacteroidales bacterium]|nr:TolC family protein [Bacteroidales bacterium]